MRRQIGRGRKPSEGIQTRTFGCPGLSIAAAPEAAHGPRERWAPKEQTGVGGGVAGGLHLPGPREKGNARAHRLTWPKSRLPPAFPKHWRGRPGQPRTRSALRGWASGPRDLGEPGGLQRTRAERGGADSPGWGPAPGAEPLQPTLGGGAPGSTPPARPAVCPRTVHCGPWAGHLGQPCWAWQ